MRDGRNGPSGPEQPTPGGTGAERVFRVLLAHGRADAELASAVAAELRGRAQTVELVELDADDAPLLEACARGGGRGLFVVARGAGLDGARVDRLRQVLRDLGVPMSRSLGLSLDVGTARAFVDRVIIVARRIGAAAEGPTPAPAPKLGIGSSRAEGSSGLGGLDPRGFSPLAPVLEPAPPAREEAPTGRVAAPSPTAPHVHLGAEPGKRRSRVPLALFAATLGIAGLVVLTSDRDGDDAQTLELKLDDDAPRLAEAPTIPSAAPERGAAHDDEPIITQVHVSAPEAGMAEDAPGVVEALRKREVRALDVFIVSPESKKPAEFAGAAKYCDKLKIAGIGDWRLPEIGELISMSRAKMVRKGSFWSSTKGDTFGDLRLVLVIKRERISPIPAGWDGGRVICVRERA